MIAAPLPELSPADREEMHALYRELHRDPELSMQEHRTANRIEAELDALGIEHFRCGGTGVVGLLRNGDGPTVAWRADTDGLPIEEATGLSYASTARGTLEDGTEVPVMHGCGHDTHVTAAVFAARLLARHRENWAGTVVFVFQPGEETGAGARAMVADGLWDRAPQPVAVYGQHVMPRPAGRVQVSSGTAMAMADALRVTVFGRQTHGSAPQTGIDPIVIAAAIVGRLQTIVSRELDPADPAVVTVGTFHAGLKENIIPERAEFTLNIRTFTQPVRDRVLAAVTRIVRAEAAAAAAPEPTIERSYDFPLCYNDPDETERAVAALRAALGHHSVAVVPPQMGSEDFGALAQAIDVPSVYWMFGGFDPDTAEPPMNHSPHFGPALEPTLSTGVRAAAAVLLARLGAR